MSDERTIKPNAPADFTPQLGDYKTLQPFRYWCQKVLPLVYDDSLSYYELLCKVVDYLNKAMEDVETLNSDVNGLHTAYTKLQSYVNNYFSTLDVQEEINKKLDELVESGRIDVLLNAFVPYVTPQMFGAKADGISDDTVAFQKCFNSNKKIIVPNGNYLVGKCEAVNEVLIELYNSAHITLKDEYFIHTTKNINIKGGRFYGESKAPESRYYAKKVITGNLTFVTITDTQFFRCIALYQTDGSYCGFINCNNMWVYDSLFIVANKSLNYVTCVGCVFQNASNMIDAPNFENIILTGCNIENVINFFSPTFSSAPYNTVLISGTYIEYSSLFNGGKCVNIIIEKCWVYTDKTLITLNQGPGSCVFSNNTVTIINNSILTNVTNCTLIIDFNVGSIIKQNNIITKSNLNLIYSGNCLFKIGNQDEYFIEPTCNRIRFNDYDPSEDKCLYNLDNNLYYNNPTHNLISKTRLCLELTLGKSDMLKVKPQTGMFCVENSSHILYCYDGTNWRKCSDGTILE